MIDLSGKPIAITGASSGIGRATALACAAAGMPVVLGARRADKLTAAVDEITARGGKAVAIPTNVDNPDNCRRLIDETVSRFGSIYAVFANAGYGFEKPLTRTSDAEIRAIFETNFYGTLNTIRPALERMQAAGAGHILICSSCLSKLGMPFLSPYSASKAAQDHIARALRSELAGTGIFVSSVHPIGTRTEFFQQVDIRKPQDEGALHTPEFFMQPPERVSSAIIRRLRRPGAAGGEIWTSTLMRVLFAGAVALPGCTDAAMRRMSQKRLKKAH